MDSNMLFPIQQHLSSALGICDSLRITDRFVTEYVTSFAPNLLPWLETAPEFGDVSFPTFNLKFLRRERPACRSILQDF